MTNKKKILFINHTSVQGGGASDDYVRMLSHLRSDSNYEIHGAFPEGPRAKEFANYCDKIFYYTGGALPVIPGAFFYYYFFRSILKQIKEFNKIFKSENYDLVILNVVVLLIPAILVRKYKLKSIIIIREEVKPKVLRQLLYKLLNKVTSNVITVAQYLSDDYSQITGNNNTLVLFSAIENDNHLDYLKFENFLKEKNLLELIDEKYKIITSIGNLCNRKNQILILKSIHNLKKLNKLNDYRFVFIGETDDLRYVQKIQKFVHEKSIPEYCYFLGNCDKNIVYNFLKKSHSLVISSFSEGFPLVIPEAFKYGTPVITTNVGGISDIVVNMHNGLFTDFTGEDLAEKILILNERSIREKLIYNGKETFSKKFNLSDNMKKFENFIVNSL